MTSPNLKQNLSLKIKLCATTTIITIQNHQFHNQNVVKISSSIEITSIANEFIIMILVL